MFVQVKREIVMPPGEKKRSRSRLGHSRWILAAALFAVTATKSDVRAQDIISKEEVLSVLDGVYVIGGDVDELLATGGLTKEQILTAATMDLSKGGVPVLDEASWLAMESAPVFHVDLQARQTSIQSPLYSVRVEVLYLVNPLSDPTITSYAMVWGEGRVGIYDASGAKSVMNDLHELIDHFLIDYRDALSF